MCNNTHTHRHIDIHKHRTPCNKSIHAAFCLLCRLVVLPLLSTIATAHVKGNTRTYSSFLLSLNSLFNNTVAMSRGVPKISGGGGDGGDIDFSSYKDPLTGRQGRLLNASSFASSSSDGSSSSSPSYQPHSSPLPPPPPPLHPASYRPVSSTAMGGGAGNDTPCQLFIGSRAGIKG